MNLGGALDEDLLKRLKYGRYVYSGSKMEEVVRLMQEWDDGLHLKYLVCYYYYWIKKENLACHLIRN